MRSCDTFVCKNIFTSFLALCQCILRPSFLFYCFVKIWATCAKFLGIWFTPLSPLPPGKKLPVRLFINSFNSFCTKSPTDTALEFLWETKLIYFFPYFQKHHLVRRLNQSFRNQILCSIEDITKDTFLLVVATPASKNEEQYNQNNQYDNSQQD